MLVQLPRLLTLTLFRTFIKKLSNEKAQNIPFSFIIDLFGF